VYTGPWPPRKSLYTLPADFSTGLTPKQIMQLVKLNMQHLPTPPPPGVFPGIQSNTSTEEKNSLKKLITALDRMAKFTQKSIVPNINATPSYVKPVCTVPVGFLWMMVEYQTMKKAWITFWGWHSSLYFLLFLYFHCWAAMTTTIITIQYDYDIQYDYGIQYNYDPLRLRSTTTNVSISVLTGRGAVEEWAVATACWVGNREV
jgi:hypothetical protein